MFVKRCKFSVLKRGHGITLSLHVDLCFSWVLLTMSSSIVWCCELLINRNLIVLMQLEMYQQQQQQPGAAMLYTASGQPVALTVESNVCQSYRSRQSVIAGAILICAGILSIIFNGISINLGEVFGFIGHGIWCGVLVSANYSILLHNFSVTGNLEIVFVTKSCDEMMYGC